MSRYGAYVMPIGKRHRGRTLAAIDALGDRDYIRWAANNVSDNKVRTAAAGYLATTEDKQRVPLVSLPIEVMAETKLSPGTKLVYAAIYTAAELDPDQRCHLSNVDIASAVALSTKQVKRSLEDLEGFGLIARVMRDAGHRDHIRITSRGDISSGDSATSCHPWHEHFLGAWREDMRSPIHGTIKRREETTQGGARADRPDTAMGDYFYRHAPDGKNSRQQDRTHSEQPELREQDYAPADWAEIQAATEKAPWED